MTVNGKTKLAIGITSILAVLAAVFTAGVNYRTMAAHVEDPRGHESQDIQEARIDSRIALHTLPLTVHNRSCAANFNRLETKLDRMMELMLTQVED